MKLKHTFCEMTSNGNLYSENFQLTSWFSMTFVSQIHR